MKKRTRYALFILAFLAGAAALYGYHLFNATNSSLVHEQAAVSLSANELLSAFDKDEAAAGREYSDKIVAVRGQVRQINKDEKGGYTIYLATEDPLKSISCALDSLYRQQPPVVKTGDSITVKGVCTGVLLDVVLIRCVLEK